MDLRLMSLMSLMSLLSLSVPPVAIAEPTRPLEGRLSVGTFHSCAIVADGQVRCWGLGEQGQLGNGRRASSAEPQLVQGVSGAVELASGNHWTCARLTDKTLRCWGATDGNYASPAQRQKIQTCRVKGRSNITYRCIATPISVEGVAGVQRLSAGINFLYAVLDGGAAVAVDLARSSVDLPSLVPLGNLTGAAQIAGIKAGSNVASGCARTDRGEVICWGENATYGPYKLDCAVPAALCTVLLEGHQVGVLGEGAPGFCALVTQGRKPAILRPKRWTCSGPKEKQTCTYVASSFDDSTHVEAVFLPGGAFYPQRIQPDPHHPSNCQTPLTVALDRRPVEGVRDVRHVATNGYTGAYALTGDGTALFWGTPSGAGEAFLPSVPEGKWGIDPVVVPGLQGAITVDERGGYGCALWPSGEVRCWGARHGVQPTRVELPPSLAVGLGVTHTCALAGDGRVLCWGDATDGKLGAGAKGVVAVPREVPGLRVALP